MQAEPALERSVLDENRKRLAAHEQLVTNDAEEVLLGGTRAGRNETTDPREGNENKVQVKREESSVSSLKRASIRKKNFGICDLLIILTL
jgi:hypothetical protein